jgi:PAS domain S-box-containing protein
MNQADDGTSEMDPSALPTEDGGHAESSPTARSQHEVEERLRIALSAAQMVAWQLNPSTGNLIVSDNASDVFGLPPGCRLEHRDQLLALVHSEDIERHRMTVVKALDACENYLSQFRLIRPNNGSIIWLEEHGHAIREPDGGVRLIGVAQDISQRKRAEEETRKVREIFKLVHSIGRIGYWEWNSLTDENKWSPEIEALYGLPPGGFEGTYEAWTKLLHPDDLPKAEEDVRRALETGKYFTEFRVIWPDGSVHWLEARAFVFKDGHDMPVRIMGVNMDVTQRKRIEEALKEADQRKNEFLATLAHELRNPLAPLRNGLQAMKLAGDDAETVESVRAMMERQLGQMVRLIDDLMDLTRISRGKLELRKVRVDLATVVHHAIETCRPLLEARGHNLTTCMTSDPIYLDADVSRLTQVLSNLLNNAAKYTERDGHITLTAERRGSEAVLSVRDNGMGIPAHVLPTIFEMFTQVERPLEKSQDGLGIGLSLVKGLVEMHGGSIEARSEGQGMGSEFTIRLPLAASLPEVATGERRADKGPAAAVTQRRILVVDDNPDAALSMAMVLKLMGCQTRIAIDGREALEAAAAFRPNVVLLDIGMPKMNGYEACRRIRQEPWGRDVVIVAVSGWGQVEDRRRSHEAGFDYHMIKPLNHQALMELLTGLDRVGAE